MILDGIDQDIDRGDISDVQRSEFKAHTKVRNDFSWGRN